MPSEKNEAFPEPKTAEIKKAREEGIKDAIQESTKDAFKAGVNEGYGESDYVDPPAVDKGVFQMQHLVDLAPDELKKVLQGKSDAIFHGSVSEGKIAGLLEVERSGKNRTETVKVLCDALGIKSPIEVTAAGPAYTNDTHQIALPERGHRKKK